jgi:hypothetical protein
VDASVRVDDPEHMNLLGLLLKGFLEKQLSDPKILRRASRLRGEYGIAAGQMAITLVFGPATLTLRKGISPSSRARVSGPMHEMLDLVSAGSLGAAVIAVLEGRISIGGNPFALLGLLPVLLETPHPPPALPPPESK